MAKTSKAKAKKAKKRRQKAAKAEGRAQAIAAASAAIGGDATNAGVARAAAQAAADSVEGGVEAAQAAAVDAAGRLGATIKLTGSKLDRAGARKAAEAAIGQMAGKRSPGATPESRRIAAENAAKIAVGVAKAGNQAKPDFVPATRRQALNFAKLELRRMREGNPGISQPASERLAPLDPATDKLPPATRREAKDLADVRIRSRSQTL